MTASQNITTKAAAEAVGTTPRQLRVFLRASDKYENVGAGGRYAFTSADLGPMKKEFDAWSKEREAAKAAAQEALAKKAEPEAKEEEPPVPGPAKKPAPRTRKPTARKTA